MTNVSKYMLILETLKLSDEAADQNQCIKQRLDNNVGILKKYEKQELNTIVKDITVALHVEHLEAEICNTFAVEEDYNTAHIYVLRLQRVLLGVTSNTNFNSDAKEELIATRHMNLCIEAVQDLSTFALREQLHAVFCKTGIFAQTMKNVSTNYALLQLNVAFFAHILKIRQFHMANAMELVLREYMTAIYTLFHASNVGECKLTMEHSKHLQTQLNYVWQHISKMEYLRNLMLLKGMAGLPADLQKQLHCELLQKLMSTDGFCSLVATLQTAQRSKEHTPQNEKQIFEVIANIVSFRGHSQRFQARIISQIFKFINLCLLNEAMADSMGAGLLALRRLYDLSTENQVLIKQLLRDTMHKLISPEDLLTGFVLMEHKEFCLLIAMWFHLFCTSIVECLPSELLSYYLPLLLQVYYNLPHAFLQKQQLGSLITRCLNNRTKSELCEIIEKLYTCNFTTDWQQLHARVLLLPNATHTCITLKIAAADYKQDFSISLALPELLMCAEHNILTYQIFMQLLKLISNILLNDNAAIDADATALLQTEQELIAFLNAKYPVKVEVLLSLNTLISHQPLKIQIAENANEFLEFLRTLIAQRTTMLATANAESTDQTLLIMLTVAQEMLENTPLPAQFKDFVPTLEKLKTQTPNLLIQQRISSLLILLRGELKKNAAHNSSAFNNARSLIESNEPHLQVYGIQMLLDLLRRRDALTLANGHVIIALALTTLRHSESYTFLNCVRLFVGLVGVMESEVLDVLSDEYLNDNADIDLRLVVGEAILKVAQELGPLCYKYKNVLLNCFMHGARSHLNEFRMSAFANLAQMCRILSYQVHKFFQELLNLIDSELTTGKYLPAKRAAVLVLSELLAGMDNLLDYEEMLLPIYRLLKAIAAAENCDDKMRLHAANGLKELAAKCKKLLFPVPEQQLQKEIQIFGIKEKPKGKLKKHILEIN